MQFKDILYQVILNWLLRVLFARHDADFGFGNPTYVFQKQLKHTF